MGERAGRRSPWPEVLPQLHLGRNRPAAEAPPGGRPIRRTARAERVAAFEINTLWQGNPPRKLNQEVTGMVVTLVLEHDDVAVEGVEEISRRHLADRVVGHPSLTADDLRRLLAVTVETVGVRSYDAELVRRILRHPGTDPGLRGELLYRVWDAGVTGELRAEALYQELRDRDAHARAVLAVVRTCELTTDRWNVWRAVQALTSGGESAAETFLVLHADLGDPWLSSERLLELAEAARGCVRAPR